MAPPRGLRFVSQRHPNAHPCCEFDIAASPSFNTSIVPPAPLGERAMASVLDIGGGQYVMEKGKTNLITLTIGCLHNANTMPVRQKVDGFAQQHLSGFGGIAHRLGLFDPVDITDSNGNVTTVPYILAHCNTHDDFPNRAGTPAGKNFSTFAEFKAPPGTSRSPCVLTLCYSKDSVYNPNTPWLEVNVLIDNAFCNAVGVAVLKKVFGLEPDDKRLVGFVCWAEEHGEGVINFHTEKPGEVHLHLVFVLDPAAAVSSTTLTRRAAGMCCTCSIGNSVLAIPTCEPSQHCVECLPRKKGNITGTRGMVSCRSLGFIVDSEGYIVDHKDHRLRNLMQYPTHKAGKGNAVPLALWDFRDLAPRVISFQEWCSSSNNSLLVPKCFNLGMMRAVEMSARTGKSGPQMLHDALQSNGTALQQTAAATMALTVIATTAHAPAGTTALLRQFSALKDHEAHFKVNSLRAATSDDQLLPLLLSIQLTSPPWAAGFRMSGLSLEDFYARRGEFEPLALPPPFAEIAQGISTLIFPERFTVVYVENSLRSGHPWISTPPNAGKSTGIAKLLQRLLPDNVVLLPQCNTDAASDAFLFGPIQPCHKIIILDEVNQDFFAKCEAKLRSLCSGGAFAAREKYVTNSDHSRDQPRLVIILSNERLEDVLNKTFPVPPESDSDKDSLCSEEEAEEEEEVDEEAEEADEEAHPSAPKGPPPALFYRHPHCGPRPAAQSPAESACAAWTTRMFDLSLDALPPLVLANGDERRVTAQDIIVQAAIFAGLDTPAKLSQAHDAAVAALPGSLMRRVVNANHLHVEAEVEANYDDAGGGPAHRTRRLGGAAAPPPAPPLAAPAAPPAPPAAHPAAPAAAARGPRQPAAASAAAAAAAAAAAPPAPTPSNLAFAASAANGTPAPPARRDAAAAAGDGPPPGPVGIRGLLDMDPAESDDEMLSPRERAHRARLTPKGPRIRPVPAPAPTPAPRPSAPPAAPAAAPPPAAARNAPPPAFRDPAALAAAAAVPSHQGHGAPPLAPRPGALAPPAATPAPPPAPPSLPPFRPPAPPVAAAGSHSRPLSGAGAAPLGSRPGAPPTATSALPPAGPSLPPFRPPVPPVAAASGGPSRQPAPAAFASIRSSPLIPTPALPQAPPPARPSTQLLDLCPLCNGRLAVKVTMKAGPNHGRKFRACWLADGRNGYDQKGAPKQHYFEFETTNEEWERLCASRA